MKKIILVAALAALAGCSQKEAAPAPEASTEAAAATSEAAPSLAADGKPSVGTFKITSHDGKVYIEEDKADGTYVTTQDGKQVETGKWTQPNPNSFCSTKDEKDAKQKCNAEKIEGGVWTTTNEKGEVSKVERVS